MSDPIELLDSYFEASAARERQLRISKPTDQSARWP
jgi:hypothetical protein